MKIDLFNALFGGHPPLAPVIREHGVWTYAQRAPTDFFTREALAREWTAYYVGRGPKPDRTLVDR